MRCVCLFPERVTICEGGVDISDSDDEDESRCHPSYFKWNVLQTSEICFGSALWVCFYIWPTRAIGVLLLAKVRGGWEGGAVRRAGVKLGSVSSPLPQTLGLNTNDLTFNCPFDSFRPSQKLRSVSPGFAAHHQIRSIVSHFSFCPFFVFLCFNKPNGKIYRCCLFFRSFLGSTISPSRWRFMSHSVTDLFMSWSD